MLADTTAPALLRQAGRSFSPAAWLHNLVQIGGYALTTERKLWLVVEHCPSDPVSFRKTGAA